MRAAVLLQQPDAPSDCGPEVEWGRLRGEGGGLMGGAGLKKDPGGWGASITLKMSLSEQIAIAGY